MGRPLHILFACGVRSRPRAALPPLSPDTGNAFSRPVERRCRKKRGGWPRPKNPSAKLPQAIRGRARIRPERRFPLTGSVSKPCCLPGWRCPSQWALSEGSSQALSEGSSRSRAPSEGSSHPPQVVRREAARAAEPHPDRRIARYHLEPWPHPCPVRRPSPGWARPSLRCTPRGRPHQREAKRKTLDVESPSSA